MWRPLFVALFAVLTVGLAADHAGIAAAGDGRLIRAVRKRDRACWQVLLTQGAKPDDRDSLGNTPLHYAALNHDEVAAKALLASGADANARNLVGATPLIYGAGSAAIVRLLLANHADPNVSSRGRSTSLTAAAAQADSATVIPILLEAGAKVKRPLSEQKSALSAAAFGGDHHTIDLLLAHGADVNPRHGPAPLMFAAWSGDNSAVQTLLAHGADPNHNGGLAGHALNFALYGGHPEIGQLLVARGADLNFPSPDGHGTPPMVWAAYNQDGDPKMAKTLLAMGVNVNAPNETGATALTYALKSGPDTPLVRYLQSRGAKTAERTHIWHIPDRPLPQNREAEIRARLQPTLDLLQKTSMVFLDTGFIRDQAKCISCHHQDLPGVAVEYARARQFRVDDIALGRQLRAQIAMWSGVAEAARQMTQPISDAPVGLGYGFFALNASGYSPDLMTDALAGYLIRVQRKEGWWFSFDRRPPMEDGPLVGTAWAALAVRDFAPQGWDREAADSLARARHWLAEQKPRTFNEAVFQLLGLHWCGETPAALAPYVARIAAQQRADGGWNQLPDLESDAWATGTALVALHEAGGMPAADPVYVRGTDFLLRTQFDDGTWWVRSRAWPFQPHFNGQFPYGKDQWISIGGTAWAAIALMINLPPSAEAANAGHAQDLIAASERSSAPEMTTRTPPASPVEKPMVDFARDIRPLLQRSCMDCHSDERPRGSFSMASRQSLLSGGQSGDPAIIPGYADNSPMVDYASGKVEDLEMPPLNRRAKYPALSPKELALLRAWIDEGAPWPSIAPVDPAPSGPTSSAELIK